MELVRDILTPTEFGILLDDDLIACRGVSKRMKRIKKNGGETYYYSFRRESHETVIQEIERLATTALNADFNYFALSFNADGHSGMNIERQLRARYTWSGFFGFFKHSRNPFDPDFAQGADAKAQFQILEWEDCFGVLTHKGLVFAFEINSDAYQRGRARDREANMAQICDKFPMAFISKSCKPCKGTGDVNRKVELRRDVAKRLKLKTDERFQ